MIYFEASFSYPSPWYLLLNSSPVYVLPLVYLIVPLTRYSSKNPS